MLNNKNVLSVFGGKTVVSEYVGFGHPDKVADQIGDALLDEYLRQDPKTHAGIEVMVKDNIVVLGGEVTSAANINSDAMVRKVFERLPYPILPATTFLPTILRSSISWGSSRWR